MKLIYALLISITLFSCGNSTPTESGKSKIKSNKKETVNRKELIENIEKTEKTLISLTNGALNHKEAKNIVVYYQKFIRHFPKDDKAADYLFKAAEVSMGLEDYQTSINLFNGVYSAYPNYKRAPDALYLVGFIYDSKLHELGKADEAYRKVIFKFPNHKYAIDARQALVTLKMSDEELIKMFKEKNKQTNAS